jgi:hypothetical protein
MQKTNQSSDGGPATLVKVLNKILSPLPTGRLDPDQLISKASQHVGLPPLVDDALYEGLSQLCQSLNTEANLTPVGRFIMKRQLLDSLRNRLQVAQWHALHPELNETITRPLIIVGLPRTGTTLLSNLLDLDPHNRSLHQWQCNQPVPPPTLANYREDQRIQQSVRKVGMAQWLVPNMQSAHPTSATLPCECIALLEDDFRSIGYDTIANVPSYWHWRDSDDMRSAYRYHKQVLQMLQHTMPTETWCLKTPGHLWALPALLETYPDALLIFTHRDLAKVIPSAASLSKVMRSGFSDHVDCMSIGRQWMEKIDTALARVAEFEARQGKDPFCHIPYTDLINNPVAAIEQIYQTAGRDVSDLFRRNIQQWMQKGEASNHGKHHYTAAEFGLGDANIRQHFSDYYQRYQVAEEK